MDPFAVGVRGPDAALLRLRFPVPRGSATLHQGRATVARVRSNAAPYPCNCSQARCNAASYPCDCSRRLRTVAWCLCPCSQTLRNAAPHPCNSYAGTEQRCTMFVQQFPRAAQRCIGSVKLL